MRRHRAFGLDDAERYRLQCALLELRGYLPGKVGAAERRGSIA